jgi:hypothetical protein
MERYELSQGIWYSCLSGQMAVHTALLSDTLVMSFTQENALDLHSVVLSLNAHVNGQGKTYRSCQKQEYHCMTFFPLAATY